MDLQHYDLLATCEHDVIPVVANWPCNATSIEGFPYRPGQLSGRVVSVLNSNAFYSELKVAGIKPLLLDTYKAQYRYEKKCISPLRILDKEDASVAHIMLNPFPYHILLTDCFFARSEEEREFWLLYTSTLRTYLMNNQAFVRQCIQACTTHQVRLGRPCAAAVDTLLAAPVLRAAAATMLLAKYTRSEMLEQLLMRFQRNCALVEVGCSNPSDLFPATLEVLAWSYVLCDKTVAPYLKGPTLDPGTLARAHMEWCFAVLKKEFGCRCALYIFQRFTEAVLSTDYLSLSNEILRSCEPP